MKAIDIVKPQAKTQLEDWGRWLNYMEAECRTAPWFPHKKIEVTYVG